MKPRIKARWIKALLSGDYTQGRNALKSSTDGGKTFKHCCLGVLCELVDPDGWSNRHPTPGYDPESESFNYCHHQCEGVLSPGVEHQVGLTSKEVDHLTHLNDEKNYTFAAIAAHIKANL